MGRASLPYILVTSGSACLVTRSTGNRCSLNSGRSVVVTRLASGRVGARGAACSVKVLQLLSSGSIMDIVLKRAQIIAVSVCNRQDDLVGNVETHLSLVLLQSHLLGGDCLLSLSMSLLLDLDVLKTDRIFNGNEHLT